MVETDDIDEYKQEILSKINDLSENLTSIGADVKFKDIKSLQEDYINFFKECDVSIYLNFFYYKPLIF